MSAFGGKADIAFQNMGGALLVKIKRDLRIDVRFCGTDSRSRPIVRRTKKCMAYLRAGRSCGHPSFPPPRAAHVRFVPEADMSRLIRSPRRHG
jgi:hypothetical protein